MVKKNLSFRIEINSKVAFGKPVVSGTRIAVEFVLELLESGWTAKKILKEYPTLTKKDLLACVGYARRLVEEWKVYPVNGWRRGVEVAT